MVRYSPKHPIAPSPLLLNSPSRPQQAAARIRRMKVSLMITCLGDVLRPAAGKATVQLLRRLGHEVEFPADQTCCGQPMFNSGFADLSCEQAKHTLKVFAGEQPVVTPSGSCAAMVKAEYPHLFEHDAEWQSDLSEV